MVLSRRWKRRESEKEIEKEDAINRRYLTESVIVIVRIVVSSADGTKKAVRIVIL